MYFSESTSVFAHTSETSFLSLPSTSKRNMWVERMSSLSSDNVLSRNSLNFSLPIYILVIQTLRISVRFFTTLREVTGKREETLQFAKGDSVTVNRVLEKLAEEHGKRFVEYVYDTRTKEVKGFLQFLINGRSTSSFEGLQTKLTNGDVLAIIPPVGGG